VLVGGEAKLGRRGLSNIPVNSACGRGSKTWEKGVKQYTCK